MIALSYSEIFVSALLQKTATMMQLIIIISCRSNVSSWDGMFPRNRAEKTFSISKRNIYILARYTMLTI